MQPESLIVEFSGSTDHGPCKCCGNNSRTVWGYLRSGDRVAAAYYVQWTLNRVYDHGANFDLILGDWGSDTTPSDRKAVSVAYRLVSGNPQFMVIDAGTRPIAADSKLAATALSRNQVVGTPLSARVYAMLDAIWLGDERIRELAGNAT